MLLLLACTPLLPSAPGPTPSATDTSIETTDPVVDVPHASAFVTQQVPATIEAGAAFTATVTMRNLGTDTWSRADGYFLGSAEPQDNFTWGTNRGWMDEGVTVAQGESVTFNLSLTAPSTPGVQHMQWQMLQDAVEWFGEESDPA